MPKNINVMYSSNTDDWKTPREIYETFLKKNYIDCFPYQALYDEFEENYSHCKLFINPPFSKMKEVIKWVIKQHKRHNKIALLIPARTDTEYFYELYNKCHLRMKLYFIKGRLHYNDSLSAPFPTILIIIGKAKKDHDKYKVITQEQIESVI